MWACLKGQTACARLLLESGATLELLDRSGHSAFTLAADHIQDFDGCVECFQLLKDWGALETCWYVKVSILFNDLSRIQILKPPLF